MDSAGDLRDVLGKYGVTSVNEKTGGGWTALMNAVAVSDKYSVGVLIDNGADLEIADDEGRTALHLAAGFAITDMTWLLLERGADMDAVDSRGLTPLMTARAGELEYKGTESGRLFTEVRRMIDVKLAERDKPAARQPGLTDVFNRYGVKSVDGITNTGWTALMHAVVSDDIAGARLLIANGANLEVRDSQRRTALFIATETLKPEMVRLLLENGADRETRNYAGRRPLDYARQREGIYGTEERNNRVAEIVELLEAPAAPPLKRPNYLSQYGRRWSV